MPVVGGSPETGAGTGGSKGFTDSGVVVATPSTVGAGVPATGVTKGEGVATDAVGFGDERTTVDDGVGAGDERNTVGDGVGAGDERTTVGDGVVAGDERTTVGDGVGAGKYIWQGRGVKAELEICAHRDVRLHFTKSHSVD